MPIHVYHINYREDFTKEELEIYRDAMIFPKPEAIETALNHHMYKKVAIVHSDDLEFAFEKTNSIDSYWGDNPEVTQVVDKNKSTSVGDLMVQDSKLYMVDSFGFKELNIELLDKLPRETKKLKI